MVGDFLLSNEVREGALPKGGHLTLIFFSKTAEIYKGRDRITVTLHPVNHTPFRYYRSTKHGLPPLPLKSRKLYMYVCVYVCVNVCIMRTYMIYIRIYTCIYQDAYLCKHIRRTLLAAVALEFAKACSRAN